ncbi:MAG: capsid assembly protein [Actinomycetota bacterium]
MAEEGEAQPTEGAAPAEGEGENLLEGVQSTQEAATPPSQEPTVEHSDRDPHKNDPNVEPVAQPEEPGERPEWLPEKFNTPEDLVQAYNEMGNTIRGKFNLPEGFNSPEELAEAYQQLQEKGPEPPEKYDFEVPEGLGELTEADEAMFREAGLTNEQARIITEKFAEDVIPAVQEKQAELEMERLGRQWQLDPQDRQFQTRLEQVKSWAQSNLPENVVAEMAKTSNGVSALYQMMQSGVEASLVDGSSGTARMTKEELDSMVQDERYWTDPAFRRDVERRLGLR